MKTHTELKNLISSIAQIGENYLQKYPKSNRGFFDLSLLQRHKNQPIAAQLRSLRSQNLDEQDFLKKVVSIFSNFKATGSLSAKVFNIMANEYPEIAQSAEAIKTAKAETVRMDDGGGASEKWDIRDYKSAIKACAPKVPELELQFTNQTMRK